MFCADYIAAFVYHAIITVGTIKFIDRFYDKPTRKDILVVNTHSGRENRDSHSDKTTKVLATEFAANGLGIPYKLDVNQNSASTSHEATSDANKTAGNLPTEKYNQVKDVEKCTSLVIPFCVGIASGLAASATLYPFDFVRSGVLTPGLKRVMSAGSTIPYAGALYGIYFSFRDPENLGSQMKWALASSTCAIFAEIPFDHAKRSMLGSTRVMLGAGLLYVPFASLMLVMYDKAAIKLVSPIIFKELKNH